MCLEIVDEKVKVKRTAYKVMRKVKDQYYPLYSYATTKFLPAYPKLIPAGVWVDEADWRLPVYGVPSYPTGWHCYGSVRAAKELGGLIQGGAIVKVKLDDCVASGTQWGYRCAVAKQMKILEEVNVSANS